MKRRARDATATTIVAALLLCVIPALHGCGDDGASDGGLDTADSDVGDRPETESGGPDDDGDTYPEGVDCDDHDAAIIPGSARPCTSACGTGTERCEAGAWVGCTAPTDCSCSPPGSTRVIDCGWCGQAGQTCGPDGIWQMPEECLYEGECGAGTTEREACGFCGERVRLCSSDCTWLPWSECEHPGDCAPALSTPERGPEGCPPGEIHERYCGSSCTWVEVTPCTADCLVPPRTGGLEEEICVPGGAFLMGTTDPRFAEADNPEHTVYLTPYLIGKYKVTNARYRTCVEAGACAEPAEDDVSYYYDPHATYDDFPVLGVRKDQAAQFCAWDGGRVLPTEAHYEKAAKGPAPRQVPFPWGDDTDTCRFTSAVDCPIHDETAVDAFPEGVSYYGIFQMDGNGFEHVQDFYDERFYTTGPTLDPVQAAGEMWVVRGTHPYSAGSVNYDGIPQRSDWNPIEDSFSFLGVRCARSAW